VVEFELLFSFSVVFSGGSLWAIIQLQYCATLKLNNNSKTTTRKHNIEAEL
jgi:hypothetical protein